MNLNNVKLNRTYSSQAHVLQSYNVYTASRQEQMLFTQHSFTVIILASNVNLHRSPDASTGQVVRHPRPRCSKQALSRTLPRLGKFPLAGGMSSSPCTADSINARLTHSANVSSAIATPGNSTQNNVTTSRHATQNNDTTA
jgi:hypothetical protein